MRQPAALITPEPEIPLLLAASGMPGWFRCLSVGVSLSDRGNGAWLACPRDAPPMSTDAAIAADDSHPPQGRRVALPVILFLATCLSTFWTGAVAWKPIVHLEALYRGIGVFAENLPQGSPLAALWEALAVAQMDWRQGLLYMGLVLGILLTHEMGHFLDDPPPPDPRQPALLHSLAGGPLRHAGRGDRHGRVARPIGARCSTWASPGRWPA